MKLSSIWWTAPLALALCAASATAMSSGSEIHKAMLERGHPPGTVLREVELPTKLNLARSGATTSIAFDKASAQTITVATTDHKTLGVRYELWLIDATGTRNPHGIGIMEYGGDLSGGVLFRQGLPKSCAIEAILQVFETDMPAEHMWQPTSSGYRVLHTVELRQSCPQ